MDKRMSNNADELSDRELEILRLVATGASNKEIATRLNISANTVKVHIRNIFNKIGASSRTEAAMYAINRGMIPMDLGGLSIAEVKVADEAGETTVSEAIPHLEKQNLLSSRYPRILIFIAVSLLIGFVVMLYFNRVQKAQSTNNPANDVLRWEYLPQLPTARSSMAVAVMDPDLYTIGGRSKYGVTGVFEAYNKISDEWRTLADKPTPVEDVQAAVLSGKVYIPGGRSATGIVVNNLDVYDPRLNQWSTGTALPTPLSAYGLAVFEGRLYLFGGWDGVSFSNRVWSFDPVLDRWTEMPSMPTSRGYLGAVVVGQVIHVIGGKNENLVFDEDEVFHPDQSENPQAAWELGKPLPEPLYGMGVASIADVLYVVGGAGNTSLTYTTLALSEQTQEWQTFQAPPVTFGSHISMINWGPSLYVVGGMVENEPQSSALTYQAMYMLSIPIIIK